MIPVRPHADLVTTDFLRASMYSGSSAAFLGAEGIFGIPIEKKDSARGCHEIHC